ncbi:MAG: aminopeptidase [Alistipes sp.]|nr:aminopeptidase [Alistipes sp.]MBQ1952730.1 aminopeptidase [Alistipes sp.]MBQ1978876.1 aminopeptidase [Alistipes sp.]MBQ5620514.1 aminopeptidase [Alistipes sp.]MBQ5903943.1 aminopeptidase [Alistipes sp.]
MKKFLTLIVALCGTMSLAAQTPEGYQFTDIKVIETTPVKNQNRSGTCWCYSTMTFLEAEILRAGGEAVHLSEMFAVRHAYMKKAEAYVRMHGHLNFAEGGAAHDVTEVIKEYGIVPNEVYTGMNYGTDLADFRELTPVMTAYLDAVIKAGDTTRRFLSTAWKRGFNAILDEYFGEVPETFVWKGKEYTPKSFAESLPINMDDYIDLSSFTHHPFYEQFVLEVPDNWMWGKVYNIPMDEMMRVVDHALENGYTLAWGTDVSEKGFSRTKAIGVIPETDPKSMSGTEAERWGAMTAKEREAALFTFDKPMKEREITQEMRQEAFDNYETTDDHGMVIVGTAKDQNGTIYYKVQNSWDTVKPYDGFWYFSKPFVAYKTTDLMVNKKALPKDIAKKLGL